MFKLRFKNKKQESVKPDTYVSDRRKEYAIASKNYEAFTEGKTVQERILYDQTELNDISEKQIQFLDKRIKQLRDQSL